MGKKVFVDLTHPFSAEIPRWPYFVKPVIDSMHTLAKGGVLTQRIDCVQHTGTHADAPKHFRNDGLSPADIDLEIYIGEALVIDLSPLGGALYDGIAADMLESALGDRRPERVLCKTASVLSGGFPDSFAHFTADSARLLVDRKVRLVGIDTPSVDRVDSKDLGAHNVFADSGVAIIENLVLDHVSPGRYELIALPLKLVGMDASPIRAVLRLLDQRDQ